MPGGSKADNPIKGPPKLSFPTFGNTASKYPQKEEEEENKPKPLQKEEKVVSNDFASFGSNNNQAAFTSGFGSMTGGELQDSQFNPTRISTYTSHQLSAPVVNSFEKPT